MSMCTLCGQYYNRKIRGESRRPGVCSVCSPSKRKAVKRAAVTEERSDKQERMKKDYILERD